jgi:hypothetical protein
VQNLGYDIEDAIDRLPKDEKYICKVCQEETTKWEKLHSQIQDVQKKMTEKVDTLCTANTAELQTQRGPVTRPPAALPKTLAAKRLRLDPGISPEVVVSYSILGTVSKT